MPEKSARGVRLDWPGALVCACVLSVLAIECAIRIPFRGDTHPPESEMVFYSWRIAHGQPLYQNFQTPPFVVAVYPPLFFWIAGALGRALGAMSHDALAGIGRALSAFFALLAAGALAAALKKESAGEERFRPALAFGLALANPLILRWAPQSRPDFAAIAFSAIGLAFAAAILRSGARNGAMREAACWLGMLLAFAAALGMKQTALAGPVAALGGFLLQRQWRRALGFAAAFGVAVALGLGFLRAAGGEWAFANLFANASVPYAIENWGRPFRYAMRDCAPGLLLLAIGLGAAAARPHGLLHAIRPHSLLLLYWIVSFGLALIASGKSGSSMNYYLEFAMAGGALGERAFAWILGASSDALGGRARAARLMLAGALAGSILANQASRPWVWHVRRGELEPFRRAAALADQLDSRPIDGWALSSDSYIAARLGRAPLILDSLLLSQLRQGGAWSPGALHAMLENGAIELIVMSFDLAESNGPAFQGIPFWPPDTLDLMRERYRLSETIGGHYIYEPNNPATSG